MICPLLDGVCVSYGSPFGLGIRVVLCSLEYIAKFPLSTPENSVSLLQSQKMYYFVWMHALPAHGSMVVMSDDNTFHHQNAQHFSSEAFGTVRNDSEVFGSVRNHSERFGTPPNLSDELERVEKYSLTVREVARMFEDAGVARTERSITNWCTPNAHGVPRLACQFEPNEHRWLITEESVRLAIAEEIVRQRELEARSERAGKNPMVDERHDEQPREEERTNERVFEQTVFEGEGSLTEKEKIIRELEYKLRDEQIASRAKDIALNRMESERKDLLDQVVKWSHRVGVLETKLLQLEAPKQTREEEQTFTTMYP